MRVFIGPSFPTSLTVLSPPAMPPKMRAVVGVVDGVTYSHNVASGIIVVGSGLVSNDRRDTFKLKAGQTLEAQLRARPKFQDLVAAATAKASQPSAEYPQADQQSAGLEPPLAEKQAAPSQVPPANVTLPAQIPAEPQRLAKLVQHNGSVLLGGSRRPSPLPESAALPLRRLESSLGSAWERGHSFPQSEAERERAYQAAQAEYKVKQRAASEARKATTAKRNREETPCACEVEALRETVHVQRQVIDTMEKVNGPLMRWLKRAAEQQK